MSHPGCAHATFLLLLPFIISLLRISAFLFFLHYPSADLPIRGGSSRLITDAYRAQIDENNARTAYDHRVIENQSVMRININSANSSFGSVLYKLFSLEKKNTRESYIYVHRKIKAALMILMSLLYVRVA